MEVIRIPETKIPVTGEADVVVVGGGPAGVGAAVYAARNGARTFLIERFGSLGGTETTGFMFISPGGDYLSSLATEIFDRLKPGGYVVNLVEKYPDIFTSSLVHYRSKLGVSTEELLAYDPDMTACVINEMMEEAGVKLLLRSLFVDTEVEDNVIKAVFIENASGKQAIKGKVFIDTTGRGDVVARSGAPYRSAGDVMGFPTPAGLMWKMSNVDLDRLFEYEKKDPELAKLIEKFKARGELQYYRPKKTAEQMKGSHDFTYTGHPHLEMMPGVYEGDVLMWAPTIHEWGINAAENAEDLTCAEIQIRKEIVSELAFLRKYVPGFEQAHLSGVAPMLGIREGRHPIGEHVLTYEDIRSGRKFSDTAIVLRSYAALDLTKPEVSRVEFDVPYRSFLPKKIDNLLLAGDNLSADHRACLHTKSFPKAMRLGEFAGTAAALSVKSGSTPKKLQWKSTARGIIV